MNIFKSEPKAQPQILFTFPGGPGVIYENGTPTLIGINVFGYNGYGGSTRVTNFLSFISDVTGIAIRSY
jgi:hypothetical protein